MNLIKLTDQRIAGEDVQTCSARELHEFLEVGRDFSNWIKDRIELYGFEQGRDFIVFAGIGDNPQGGRPAKEYALTIDMAKELAMVERNAKGKQARQYFIECEKKLRAMVPPKGDEKDVPAIAFLTAREAGVEYGDALNILREMHGLDRIWASDAPAPAADAPKPPLTRRQRLRLATTIDKKEFYELSHLAKLANRSYNGLQGKLTKLGWQVHLGYGEREARGFGVKYSKKSGKVLLWRGDLLDALELM